MKGENANGLQLGNLADRKFKLDPKKLGLMNKINWQKYIKPDNTAFIMVDMQKDILAPDGTCSKFGGYPMWEAIGALANTKKLVKAARKYKMKIYWIRGGYYGLGKDIPPDSPLGERMALLQAESPGALIRTNWDYEIIDELQDVIEPQDIIMDKSGSSSFIGTDLQQCLVREGIKNIIICGCMTDVCVDTTARSGSDLGYLSLVVADACVSNTWENQYNTLYHLSNIYATITITDEIIKVLKKNNLK